MVKLNHHFSKLTAGYLFPEIERRVTAWGAETGISDWINLGIGDVTQPLAPSLTAALEAASREMGSSHSFRGYGPSQGYPFLREAIAHHDYRGLDVTPSEVFISDGAKNDLGNLQELFALETRIAVPDPTYPVYIDTNVMAGRTRLPLKVGGYGGVVYLPCTESNQFIPDLPNRPCELIYLCSPNNPTGSAMTREALEKWVRFAKEQRSILLFDGAYEAYIRTPGIPRSIYEIEGAKEVAVEIRSFSKTAGFTGLRCSYTVVPHALKVVEGNQTLSLHQLWKRRHETKFGGVPYPVQKAAAAVYSPQGQIEVRAQVDGYLRGAKLLREGLQRIGYQVYGGIDAPYLWLKTPDALSSWECFDLFLKKARVISVPGSGFGSKGEGYVRLSAFAPEARLVEALERIEKTDLLMRSCP
jgi:LL-diaminopimelate aminotransferase